MKLIIIIKLSSTKKHSNFKKFKFAIVLTCLARNGERLVYTRDFVVRFHNLRPCLAPESAAAFSGLKWVENALQNLTYK